MADDGLEWDVGAQRHFVGAGADLDSGAESFLKLLPAFVVGPILSDFPLSEVDEVERPPFLDFERTLEGEGIEEGKLPVVVLREVAEHRAH